MKSEYERLIMEITQFDTEDVITTSGLNPEDPTNPSAEKENAYGEFDGFDTPGLFY